MSTSLHSPGAVSLFSTLAVKKALDDVILDAFTTETGVQVDGTFDPTNVLLQLLKDGARPDVLIAVSNSLDALGTAGIIDPATRTPIARTGVGIAVAPGLPVPDISTVEALIATLTQARAVAYSRTGASGVYFAQMLKDLGIADEVNSRAVVVEKGFTALAAVDGRADLAVQQMSELLFVPEATVIGPLPDAVQNFTEFSAALGSAATGNAQANALINFLTSAGAHEAYAAAGLEPIA